MKIMARNTHAGAFRLSEYLPFRIFVLSEQIGRVFAEHYERRHNLTMPEWRLLAAVAEHRVVSPTRVGTYTHMDKVKVSRAAQSLVTKGLIRQSPDPSDGRGRLLRLTRKGISVHSRMVALALRLQGRLFGVIARPDFVALERVLGDVVTRARAIDPDAASG